MTPFLAGPDRRRLGTTAWLAGLLPSLLVACGTSSSSPGGALGHDAGGGTSLGTGGGLGARSGNGGLANGGGSSGATAGGGGSPSGGGGAGGIRSGAGGAGAGTSGGGGVASGGSPSVDGGGASMWRELASPPTYMGTANDAAGCTTKYRTFGVEPVEAVATRHPLFLYFVGTAFSATDPSAAYDSLAARAVTGAMARRGFVALSVEYDNGAVAWLSDHVNQLGCLFDASNAQNVLAAACALPNVDCDLGIGTWGHSQGALVADLAAAHEPRVRAVWATGYGGDARATLPRNRFRLVNGEGDTGNAAVPGLNKTAGFTLTECPDDGRKTCLRTDGSGWIIVLKSDCAVTAADHCWFDKKSCLDTPETLEPNWIDPASTKPFALEANADWVAQTVRRP